MAEETYGRGQVEWALWRSFTRQRYGESEIPKPFRTRIKRLLDIDRTLDLSEKDVLPESDYAFAARPTHDGSETEYEAIDTFCLAIGLDLIDCGFKQQEVVFLMRYLRTELVKRFVDICGEPRRPSWLNRQLYSAKDYPLVSSFERKGKRYADGRVFMILQKVELSEFLPSSSTSKSKQPVISPPLFCDGVEALASQMAEDIPNHWRTGTILELTSTAQAVNQSLKDAPIIRRGRPKA